VSAAARTAKGGFHCSPTRVQRQAPGQRRLRRLPTRSPSRPRLCGCAVASERSLLRTRGRLIVCHRRDGRPVPFLSTAWCHGAGLGPRATPMRPDLQHLSAHSSGRLRRPALSAAHSSNPACAAAPHSHVAPACMHTRTECARGGCIKTHSNTACLRGTLCTSSRRTALRKGVGRLLRVSALVGVPRDQPY
jgi:hypothetical protein